MPMAFGPSAPQANGRAYQRDGGVFQQDRDSSNAIRHHLLSEWCWGNHIQVIRKDFHALPSFFDRKSSPLGENFH